MKLSLISVTYIYIYIMGVIEKKHIVMEYKIYLNDEITIQF